MTARKSPATTRRRHKGHFGHKGHFDRGAAAVEMALVMPLLILMIMGIIDFGRIFNGEIQLSQAAREGARIAALGGSGTYFPPDVVTRAKAALNNPAFSAPQFIGSPSCVSTNTTGCIAVDVVTATGDVVTASPPVLDGTGRVCQSADSAANYGRVIITIPYLPILFGPTSLSQKAVMKCSG